MEKREHLGSRLGFILLSAGCAIGCTIDMTGCSRRRASFICCIVMLILVMPCILGFNVLSGFQPFGEGTSVQDLEDFIVSNILLPLGSLVYVLFCVIPRVGWGWKNFLVEVNAGKGMKVRTWMYGYYTFFLPIVIVGLFTLGILSYFHVINL